MKRITLCSLIILSSIFGIDSSIHAQATNPKKSVISGKAGDAGSTERWKNTGSNLLLLLGLVVGGMTVAIVMANRKSKKKK